MKEFDKELRNTEEWSDWEQKGTYKYAIVHEGRRYPVKQIISMATGETKTSFSGGFEANSYVSKRGLSVVPLQNSTTEANSLNIRDGLEEILAHYASHLSYYDGACVQGEPVTMFLYANTCCGRRSRGTS
jgi:hypothetical protein